MKPHDPPRSFFYSSQPRRFKKALATFTAFSFLLGQSFPLPLQAAEELPSQQLSQANMPVSPANNLTDTGNLKDIELPPPLPGQITETTQDFLQRGPLSQAVPLQNEPFQFVEPTELPGSPTVVQGREATTRSTKFTQSDSDSRIRWEYDLAKL